MDLHGKSTFFFSGGVNLYLFSGGGGVTAKSNMGDFDDIGPNVAEDYSICTDRRATSMYGHPRFS